MSKHLTVTRMCAMPYEDFQSFFSVFTQISPAVETLGWNIFVASQPISIIVEKLKACSHKDRHGHFGGAAGNSLVNLNFTVK